MGVWYPTLKCTSDEAAPDFVNLDLWESAQVQEAWAIDGSVGPEVMTFRDGCFCCWFPKLSIDCAIQMVRRMSGVGA